MPERSHQLHTRKTLLRLTATAGLLLFGLVVYTGLHPVAVEQGDAERICLESVEQYAEAVKAYREQKGWLPHSLDQLVPIYLPEHLECRGTHFAESTKTGLSARLRSLFSSAPPPCRPDYNLVLLPSGEQSFEIVCNRNHPGRCAYRGDAGSYILANSAP